MASGILVNDELFRNPRCKHGSELQIKFVFSTLALTLLFWSVGEGVAHGEPYVPGPIINIDYDEIPGLDVIAISGLVVGQELMGHRVAKQVWRQLHADDRRILVAQRSHAFVGQRSPFADEHYLRLDRWS